MDKAVSTRREHAIPGEIKRDTAANIAGGKQVNFNKSGPGLIQVAKWLNLRAHLIHINYFVTLTQPASL